MDEPCYIEAPETGNPYRRDYLNSIEALIDRRLQEAARQRERYFSRIADDPASYRRDLRRLLGWPLTEERQPLLGVHSSFVAEDNGYTIYRMQFEIFRDFFFYGILFLKDDSTPRPLVISQHGGQGTPESCSDMLGGSNNYHHMTRRLLAKDVNVFAPQLLLWNNARHLTRPQDEGLHMDQIRRPLDQRLKQTGASITALEIHCLQTVLDYLEKQPFVDPARIGMCGLSYGGFYALFAAALDERLRATVSSSFFNDRSRYNWSDFVWDGSGERFFDSEIALMTYPRKLHIEVGERDSLFDATAATREYERLAAYCQKLGDTDWLTYRVFDGKHQFPADDEPIDRLVAELKE